MGSCLSISISISMCIQSDPTSLPPTAQVISTDGSLHQYNLPASVSHVLLSEAASSSNSDHHPPHRKWFLCDSDLLAYDEFIPELKLDAQLQPDHLYFLLPRSKLRNKVAASDMASLAVKASLALQSSAATKKHRRRKGRISPVLLMNHSSGFPPTAAVDDDDDDDSQRYSSYSTISKNYVPKQQQQAPLAAEQKPYANNSNRIRRGLSRSGSVRRLQKQASQRARFGGGSFRISLAPIFE